VSAPGDYDNGEIGGMIGRGNRSTRRKPALVLLCPPQTPHAARTRTWAATVGSQRLTAELRHGLYVNLVLPLLHHVAVGDGAIYSFPGHSSCLLPSHPFKNLPSTHGDLLAILNATWPTAELSSILPGEHLDG
jgi:hypothetical protein